MKKEIVVTGRGLVTPLGIGLAENEKALRCGESGIVSVPEWRELGMESQVAGLVSDDIQCPFLDKKAQRYMSPNSVYAASAAYEALQEAGLTRDVLESKRVAVVLGHGGSCLKLVYDGARTLIESGKSKRVSPFIVPKAMPSSSAANLSLILGIKGESYVVSSACASGSHAIMLAARLLGSGAYDIVISGGTEELNWVHALGFDAMRATSRGYNDRPKQASRPFDKARDGFVIAAGAGIVVMETAEHARSRGVKPSAKICSAVANSNATDMVSPDSDASAKLMMQCINEAGLDPSDIDYINTHGTATSVGDPIEMEAIKKVFAERRPDVAINSTKSMTGHMIGATGAVEIIFCTQMLKEKFICPTINLENPEPEFSWANLPVKTIENAKIRYSLSNSFGFGGTNSCTILSSVD